MNSVIKADLYRYTGYECSLLKGLKLFYNFRVLYFKRKWEIAKSPLSKLLLQKLYHLYEKDIQIPIQTKIGKGLYIGHTGTIVINENAILGENCNITHNVTIGQTNRGKYKGTPTIGNKVWIGTGSVIVGKIVIGDNVLISPNSYVNRDIPSNCVYINDRIIPNGNATKDYIDWCL